MLDILNNERFATAYERMKKVRLNPRRHTSANGWVHSESVSERAAALAELNGRDPSTVAMMRNLGRAHDIGKITGTARPERSLEVLAECGALSDEFLELVKWHDTSLPWFKSSQRGSPVSDKAWQRLAERLDLELLCMFMVADREDAPPGWRRNAPTAWFVGQARSRGFVSDELRLDLPGIPSEISAGGALVHEGKLLLIRTRSAGWELPKGGIEWDELPADAAARETREEAGLVSPVEPGASIGTVEYEVERDGATWTKRVDYFALTSTDAPKFGALPPGTRERQLVSAAELAEVALLHDNIAAVAQAALAG